jgi:hypothetical protein
MTSVRDVARLLVSTPLVLSALASGAAFGGSGCASTPNLAENLGTDYTKKDKGVCQDTGGQSRPLVVDWDSTDRAELEARASRGLVVVKYAGCKMDVLKRCAVKGTPAYEYVGLTPKHDTVTMRDANEVYANIPVYAAKFEGKLAQSGSLQVAMTIVGQFDTSRPVARKDELEGDCDGATHVVTALTVGSYEFYAAQSTEQGASVAAFGAEAGGKQAKSKEVLNKDGDTESCGKANGEDPKPPYGCGALLRLEVVPLGTARLAEPTCSAGMSWDGNQCVVVKSGASCKPGEIADKDRGCVAKKVDVVRVATATVKGGMVAPVKSSCGDAATCQASCDKGDANGCLGLGGALRAGLKQGTPSDDGKKAQSAFQKACDGGEPTACTALGEMLYQGLGVAKDTTGAIPLLEKACSGGDPAGCNDLGLARSLSGDHGGAKKYFEMSCNAKSQLGCLGLGMLYKDGKGVAKDPGKAKELFKKACDGKVAAACKLL